jgi:hypothetical protein
MKQDLKNVLKDCYNPSSKEFSIIDVPTFNFLMIDGSGDPNTSPEYQAAIEALYSISYTLKFSMKKSAGIDYLVMPLEGLWWADDLSDMSDKSLWKWTAMIMQPDFISEPLVHDSIEASRGKRGLPSLEKLHFEPYAEGLSVQILYYGPYSEEGPTISRMHTYIREHGFELAKKHHEIYIGDPRRCAPEKLKTILRQPVRRI